ncbi:MAG: methyltransferase domain-containing protein [Candidatus Bathyarchaeota archaeon]|nr:methyltransferase domain-containing protein [Candidatus Bathyarchaeota archaeon]
MYIRVLKALAVSSWRQKRSVMRRYDLTAQMYDERYLEEQEAKYKAALEDLNLRPTAAVLDLGCGTGLFFSYVADKVAMVVGVDASRKLLALARDRAKALGNVYVVLADADHLPFRRGFFGFAFAFTVLQNMPKPAETLKHLVEASAEDARFVLTGLKAAVSLEQFGAFLEAAGLQAVSLRNNDALRCHVVRCIQRGNR